MRPPPRARSSAPEAARPSARPNRRITGGASTKARTWTGWRPRPSRPTPTCAWPRPICNAATPWSPRPRRRASPMSASTWMSPSRSCRPSSTWTSSPLPIVDLYDVGFSASYQLDLFGRIRRGVEAAKADDEAVQAGARPGPRHRRRPGRPGLCRGLHTPATSWPRAQASLRPPAAEPAADPAPGAGAAAPRGWT